MTDLHDFAQAVARVGLRIDELGELHRFGLSKLFHGPSRESMTSPSAVVAVKVVAADIEIAVRQIDCDLRVIRQFLDEREPATDDATV